eukprot:13310282-Alexandrium_andersonii.AAC.1
MATIVLPDAPPRPPPKMATVELPEPVLDVSLVSINVIALRGHLGHMCESGNNIFCVQEHAIPDGAAEV